MLDRLIGLLVLAVLLAVVLRSLAAGLIQRPQRGVLLLAALAPFNGLLLLVPHPGVVNGWKEALVVCVLASTLLAPPGARAASPIAVPGWVPAAVGLVVLGLASAAFVAPTQAAVGLKIDFFYLLLPIVLLRCPLSAAERDRLVSILMGTGVLTAAYGVAQQIIGAARLSSWGYEYNTTIRTAGSTLRSFSSFNQPFGFGLFEMVVLLVALPVALSELSRTRNRIFLAMTPLILLGLLSSIVRAAIAGLLVGGFFLWLHRYRVLSHAVPPALVALVLLPPALFATLLSPSSLGERSAGWTETFGRVLSAPFGNGIGATGSAAEKVARVSGRVGSTYQPDNYYFKTVFELGPLGLWLFVLLLISAGLLGLAASRRLGKSASASAVERRDAALAAGFAASVVAAAAASTVATYFEIFPLDLLFWLLLGVVSSLPTGSASPLSPCDPRAAGSRPTSESSSMP
jgi:hypothetical protein